MTEPTPGSPPVCYRHPGRETYVRCGRCGRYICPDDMISAAVGFQCPDCVRAGNRGVREARTRVGGRIRGDAGVVTLVIIAINVVIFFAVQGSDELLERLVLRPFSTEGDGVAEGGWYRLLTAAFLQEAPLHITLNMLMLYLFGRPLEAQLGRVRYIATYLGCALGGSVVSYAFMEPLNGSLGASGAVFGMVGALLIVEKQFRHNPGTAVVYLAILLLPGFYLENIDWRGHLGGLVTGCLLGAIFVYAPARNRTIWHGAGIAALVLLLLVAVGLRTDKLRDDLRDAHAELFGAAGPGRSSTLGTAAVQNYKCVVRGAQRHWVEVMNPPVMNPKPTSRL